MKLNVIITGATGMVGKGALLECLESPEVESVLLINRMSIGIQHPKLKETILKDFMDLSEIKENLRGFNSCFFCLGVSSAGMSEEKYSKITYDLTLHFATTLSELNPEMTFIYVSGAGTDSTEKKKSMWARVKGRTENDLLKLSFKGAYMFRPGYIHPMKGIKSKTALYNGLYIILKPVYPLLKRISPKSTTTSVQLGKAMISVGKNGYANKILGSPDINSL